MIQGQGVASGKKIDLGENDEKGERRTEENYIRTEKRALKVLVRRGF